MRKEKIVKKRVLVAVSFCFLLAILALVVKSLFVKFTGTSPQVTPSVNLLDVSVESLTEKFKSAGIEFVGVMEEKNQEIIATLSSGTVVLVKKGANADQVLASLQLILKNIRIEGKWPVKIDLRFSRPVLVY